MSRRKTAILVLLAVAVATGMILPVSALTGPSSTAERPATTQQSSERVSPEVGQQLSTVVVATTEEVRTEADNAAFEQQLNDTNATERAEAVAERAAQLDQRASALRAEYQSLTESYQNDEIDGSTYAQELARLAARASALNSSVDALHDRAGELSDAERRAVDVTDEDLQAISAQLDPVSGSTAAAILSQFTGESRGEIALEVDGGIALEVSSEDGEQSRQFERPRDGNGTLVLNQSEALAIATDALSQQDGEWVLTSVGTDEGAYEFEFDLHGPAEAEGEAEVAVDGETGTVFELEEAVEFEEEDDDDDDDDEDEREDDRLALRVTDGEPAPGATVTLSITQGGEAVENASVAVNEETVGTTDANGTLTVTFPESEEVKIKTTAGEAEGELEFEFEDEEEDDEEELGATADISDGTVTVSVVLGDQPVEGASVTANGESVGQTDANGTVTFPLPDGDELEIEITDGDREAELEYEFENEEEDEDEEEAEEEDEREEDEEEDEDEAEDDDADEEESDDEQEDGTDEEDEADEESDEEESDDEQEDADEDEADEESDDDDAEDEESDDDTEDDEGDD